MADKLAIAVIHGIGKTVPEFADPRHENYLSGLVPPLRKAFAKHLQISPEASADLLEFQALYWAPVLQERQDELFQRLDIEETVSSSFGLRDFIFHALADAVAYQPPVGGANSGPPSIYRLIHETIAASLANLADRAGTDAPLCVIGHSMGSAVASNYLWDLQAGHGPANVRDNPLERGDTFRCFYTFGSQIPFWSLRYRDFGSPIQVPAPAVRDRAPSWGGEWLNFYDRDDLLGYPIGKIYGSEAYRMGDREYPRPTIRDIPVNVGNMLTNWNTLSHNEYWRDPVVTDAIGQSLARLWKNR